MKFLVNGMYLTSHATGIANVIINIVNQISLENDVILIANKEINEEIKKRITDSVKYIIKPCKISNRTLIWFLLKLPKILNKLDSDVILSPAVWMPYFLKRSKKNMVVVLDFVSRDFKKTMKFWNRTISNIIEKRSITKADYLWCISEYTKRKLEGFYPQRTASNIFVGCGPDPFITKISVSECSKKNLMSKFNIETDFILFVGSLEPRKNLRFLLKMYQEFHKSHNYQLVVVGARGWGKTSIAEIVNSSDFPRSDVIFTGFVTEEDLRKLYNIASCFISTSLNEGFGLPQAEAMKCECPVVTSHNSAMIEVVEGAGITVKSWNIDEWIEAIDFAIDNKKNIIEKQNIKISSYNWNNIYINLKQYLLENK